MTDRRLQALVLGLALSLFCVTGVAQQKVYKWVDEEGVTHFSDAPPEGAEQPEVDSRTLPPPAPPPPTPPQGDAAPPAAPAPSAAVPADAPASSGSPASSGETPPGGSPAAAPMDPMALTLPELDARCEAARESRIAPLREAEIEKCKQDRRDDPAWCERFNASFGEGGRNVNGTIRPRMFDDLPECAEALQERNRRGR